MTMKFIAMATAAALVAPLLGATIAFAQGNPAPAAQQPPHQGMMMDRGGMMGMTQMNRMMENCNRMMESMSPPSSGAPNPAPNNG